MTLGEREISRRFEEFPPRGRSHGRADSLGESRSDEEFAGVGGAADERGDGEEAESAQEDAAAADEVGGAPPPRSRKPP
jgi:hypothetical protein